MVKPAMATDTATTTDHQNNVNSPDSSKYKGVRKRKWGKWVSEIRLPNSRERIWLGSYDTAEKAARAFDAALYCLRGRHASFNFRETPQEIINIAGEDKKSLTSQEIQRIAARFANEQDDHRTNQGPQHNKESSELGTTNSFDESGNGVTGIETSSSSMYDGNMHLDHMDWSFWNLLDSSSEAVGSEYDLGTYSGLDKMHSGELLYSPDLPATVPSEEDNFNGDDNDVFSFQQSFLWNF